MRERIAWLRRANCQWRAGLGESLVPFYSNYAMGHYTVSLLFLLLSCQTYRYFRLFFSNVSKCSEKSVSVCPHIQPSLLAPVTVITCYYHEPHEVDLTTRHPDEKQGNVWLDRNALRPIQQTNGTKESASSSKDGHSMTSIENRPRRRKTGEKSLWEKGANGKGHLCNEQCPSWS